MSLLDDNFSEKITSKCEDGLQIHAAKLSPHFMFSNSIDCWMMISEVHDWIYKHWGLESPTEEAKRLFQDMDYMSFMNSQGMRELAEAELSRFGNDLTFARKVSLREAKLFTPDTFMSAVILEPGMCEKDAKNPQRVVEELPIENERTLLPSYFNTLSFVRFIGPQPILFNGYSNLRSNPVSAMPLNSMNAYQTQLHWQAPVNGCTFVLNNVDYIPSRICSKDDDGFYHWFCPIEKIYIYNSPNLDPEIKELPYVITDRATMTPEQSMERFADICGAMAYRGKQYLSANTDTAYDIGVGQLADDSFSHVSAKKFGF